MSARAVISPRTALLTLSSLLWVITASPGLAQFGNPGGLPTAMAIQVDTAEHDGSFLRNGVVFDPDYLDGGRIELESSQGDVTTLGLSWNQTYGPLHLIQGHYTPRFTSIFETPTAPRANSRVFAPPVDLTEGQSWNPNVPAIRAQFSFRLNGGSFPGSSNEIADFYLRDATTGRELHIGTSQDGTAIIFIIPGVYDVIYAHRSGSFIPQNTHARVLQAVEIREGTTLVVDVPMVDRTFSYSLDGAPFPTGDLYVVAQFSLDNPDTGDSLVLGRTFSYGRVPIRIIPGIYRALYAMHEGASSLPNNRQAVLEDAVKIAPDGSLVINIDVTSYLVDVEFQFDGGPTNSGLYDRGNVFLDHGNGDRFQIGDTYEDLGPIRLVAGTYDAYYEAMESNAFAPVNPNTRFAEDLLVDADGPLVLNIEMALLTLDLNLNGEDFPTSLYETGRVRIVDSHTKAEFILGSTREGPHSARLIQGSYDVTYEHREGGYEVPVNEHHVIAHDLAVEASSTQTINVETQVISPSFALNDGAFPTSATEYGEFFLRSPGGGRISLGNSNAPPPDLRVIESAYAIDYEWRDGQDVPINHRETVQIVSVPEAGFASSLLLGVLGVLLLQAGGRRRFTEAVCSGSLPTP